MSGDFERNALLKTSPPATLLRWGGWLRRRGIMPPTAAEAISTTRGRRQRHQRHVCSFKNASAAIPPGALPIGRDAGIESLGKDV
jgi:hypothetical protein